MFLAARLGPITDAHWNWLLGLLKLPAVLVLLHTIPILLACIFLYKYIFKSAEGISGAING